MNLSEHFTLEEFTFTVHRNIDNTPSPLELEQLKQTAANMEDVRKLLQSPIHVNSAFRCLELNRLIGSSDKSQHPKGQAVDFTAQGFGTPDQIIKVLKKSNIPFDQLIREFDRWVHISFSHAPRRQVLIIDKRGTRLYGT